MRMLPVAHINDVDLHGLGELHDLDAGAHERRAGLHGAEPRVADGQRHYLGARRHAVALRLVREVAGGDRGYVRAVRC